jgi:hypothetical protein
MSESRSAPRHDVLKAGTISFGGRSLNCLVRDLSTTGAAIEVAGTGFPTRFMLAIPGDGLHLPCRVVWRKDHRVGVAFS